MQRQKLKPVNTVEYILVLYHFYYSSHKIAMYTRVLMWHFLPFYIFLLSIKTLNNKNTANVKYKRWVGNNYGFIMCLFKIERIKRSVMKLVMRKAQLTLMCNSLQPESRLRLTLWSLRMYVLASVLYFRFSARSWCVWDQFSCIRNSSSDAQ